MKRVLFTPGPTEVPSEVLEAMAKPLIHHRTDEYRQYFLETTRLMQEHLATTHPVLTLSCSGSGAMEAAVVNLLSAGDQAIVVEGGKFGARWGMIAQAYGVTVHTVSVEWGRVATVEEVESAVAPHPKAKVMFITHSETSTGALFPVHDMARAAKARGVATVIDAVTSFGVYDLHFDRSDVAGLVWGSQKGMMIPPGLGFVCLSPRGRGREDDGTALRRQDRGRSGPLEGKDFPPRAHRPLRRGGYPPPRGGLRGVADRPRRLGQGRCGRPSGAGILPQLQTLPCRACRLRSSSATRFPSARLPSSAAPRG